MVCEARQVKRSVDVRDMECMLIHGDIAAAMRQRDVSIRQKGFHVGRKCGCTWDR